MGPRVRLHLPPRSWILDAGCWILDAGFWILDRGTQISDLRSQIPDPRPQIPDPRPQTPDPRPQHPDPRPPHPKFDRAGWRGSRGREGEEERGPLPQLAFGPNLPAMGLDDGLDDGAAEAGS